MRSPGGAITGSPDRPAITSQGDHITSTHRDGATRTPNHPGL